MTTNRMGLEWEDNLSEKKKYPSDQYLNEILINLDFAANIPIEAVRVMARELLAYRKVSKEPVADVVAWNKSGEERKCDIRWRRFDVEPGPLFAAPQLASKPCVKLQPRKTAADYVDEEFTNEDMAMVYNTCRLECEVKIKNAGCTVDTKGGE